MTILLQFVKAERGSALVMVLIFTAALLILGGALVSYASNDRFIAAHQEDNTRLYYITEAGIEAGVAALRQNYSFHSTISGEIDGGSYHATVVIPPDADYPELSSGERLVISTGQLEGKTLTLKAIVSLDELYSKALMVSESLQLQRVLINGNLHFNNALKVVAPGESIIRGDLSYPEGKIVDIVPPAELIVEGETVNEPPIPIPKIDFDSFSRDPDFIYAGDQNWSTAPSYKKVLVEGNLTISPGNNETFDFDGVIIVKGDLFINPKPHANTYLNGSFVADGEIQVQPQADINPGMDDRKVIFVSNEKITITTDDLILFGGSVLFFSSICDVKGSSGDIIINGPSNYDLHIYGTIVAEGTLFLSRCELTYDPDVFQDSDYIPGLQVVVKEWLRP